MCNGLDNIHSEKKPALSLFFFFLRDFRFLNMRLSALMKKTHLLFLSYISYLYCNISKVH